VLQLEEEERVGSPVTVVRDSSGDSSSGDLLDFMFF